jgi:O-antigen/teichoic acid export membrane protein
LSPPPPIGRIAKNTGVIVGGDLLNRVLSLLGVVVLARYLGSSGYGEYSLVLAYVSFFPILSELGIGQILFREMSRDEEKRGIYVGNALFLQMFLSILSFLLAVSLIRFLDYSPSLTGLIYLYSLTLLFTAFSPLLVVFGVHLRMEYPTFVNLFNRFLSLLIILTVAFTGRGLRELFLLLVLAGALATLLNIRFALRFIRPRFHLRPPLMRFLLRESWPVALSGLLVTAYLRVGYILLSKMEGEAALGYYAAATNLVEPFLILPIALSASLFPFLSRWAFTSRERYTQTYELTFKYTSLLFVPLAVGITLSATPVIRLVYGSDFLPAVPALQILVWAEVFMIMYFITSKVLLSANRQRMDLLFTAVMAVSNLSLNLLLIPRYGIVGAAIAALASYASGPIAALFLPPSRPFALSLFRSMVRPLIASTLIVFSFFLLPHRSLLSLMLGGLLYTGAIYAIGGLTKKDIDLWKRMIPGSKE